MQVLQSRNSEAPSIEAAPENLPLAGLAEDLDRLNAEIRSLYKEALPPAVIHQISRGAREQASIGKMILHDCTLRAANGTLNPKHLANAEKWIAGVRRWMEERRVAHAVSARRKLFVIRSAR